MSDYSQFYQPFQTKPDAAFWTRWKMDADFRKFVGQQNTATLEKIREQNRNNLTQAGAVVRRTARQSIRTVKNPDKHSRPGEPPKSHTGRLKNAIRFEVDETNDTVVVGPEKNKPGNVPEVLEYGGFVGLSGKWKVRIFRYGEDAWGPVDVSPTRHWPSHQRTSGVDGSGERTWMYTVRRPLTTPAMASRATRLWNEILHSGRLSRLKKQMLEARPYMAAALQKNRRKLMEIFLDSLR